MTRWGARRSRGGSVALLLLAAAPVVACRGREPAPQSPGVAASGAPAAPARLRGSVIVQSDSSMIFVACGSTAERRVTAPPSAQLTQAITSVNGALRDSLFVDISADTGAGTVTVRDTHFASPLQEGSPCDRPRGRFDWDARGNEPFWRVTVDSAQVVFERPEPPRELVFDATATHSNGTLTTIIATRALGRVHELKLGLLREPCRDGMSDNWYPYRAELRLGDVAMHGCATKGDK